MSANEKPRPSLAVLQWIDAQGVDAEAAVNNYQTFEGANVLGNRIGRAVWMTEAIAGNLARGTIGRRQAVGMLRDLHQVLFELGRDLDPSFPPQSRERWLWNNAAGELAPWQPHTVECENQFLGRGEEGAE
jgi:hypothetical protein